MWLARCYHLLISILHITKRICCSCFGSLVAKTWSQRRRREGWVASSRHGWLAICISTLIFSISIPPFALKHILDFLSLISSVVERIYPEYISRFCLEIDDHVTIFAIHWIIITRISTTFYNCPPICHIGFSPLIITNERVLHNWKFKRTPLEFPKLANVQLLTLDT